MINSILQKAKKDLDLTFDNDTTLDIGIHSLNKIKAWLWANGFIESKVRVGRYINSDITVVLQLDNERGLLYIPSL